MVSDRPRIKVLIVFGTRPEAIKMAPVVKALAASPALSPVLCLTGQHRDMLAGVLRFFGLAAVHDLAVTQPEQELSFLAAVVAPSSLRGLPLEQAPFALGPAHAT